MGWISQQVIGELVGYLVGVLVLVVGLLVSISLHELGHMLPAKRFGVRVSRYMVGFGPTLWSRTRGETEYGLKAIPLGGYVRLVGMVPPAESVGAKPGRGWTGEVVQATRDASAEEILPGEDHRAFYRLSTPKKVVVMLGGPVMNVLIAVVLLTVAMVGIGEPIATTTVAAVVECVQPLAETGPCTAVDPPTPAAVAGVEPGDVLVFYAGQPVESWDGFVSAVQGSPGEQVPLVVERDGQRVTLQVAPVLQERPVTDDAGSVVVGTDGEPETQTVPYVGVGPGSQSRHQPLAEVPGELWKGVWGTAKVIGTLPVQVWNVAQSVFGGAQRDPNGLLSVWGVGQVAGEIGAEDGASLGTVGQVRDMLGLLAALNIALFVFNLIPLLPLDGGHVAGALWEGGKRQVARLRGLPRPAPADMARMMPLAYGVFVVLIGMSLLLIYADIVKPMSIG